MVVTLAIQLLIVMMWFICVNVILGNSSVGVVSKVSNLRLNVQSYTCAAIPDVPTCSTDQSVFLAKVKLNRRLFFPPSKHVYLKLYVSFYIYHQNFFKIVLNNLEEKCSIYDFKFSAKLKIIKIFQN